MSSGGFMNIADHTQKDDYSYCKYEASPQLKKDSKATVHMGVSKLPPHKENVIAPIKKNEPSHIVYPKHTEPARMPVHPQKPGTTKITKLIEQPQPVKAENNPQMVIPPTTILTTNPPIKPVNEDSWWQNYDEHLKRILK